MRSLVSLLPFRETTFRFTNRGKPRFDCPVCGYSGPFRDISALTGRRQHARCARCGALERHRLQSLVQDQVFSGMNTRSLRMLHFAPEKFFRKPFARRFGVYETADISGDGVDHRADLQALPFPTGSYDVIYASHVLEHVQDDSAAIAEIRRVLAPGGIAILPVPLVVSATIEYPEPNAEESMHVRAPGADYFDRYRAHFERVDLFGSHDYPERHQLYAIEDRSSFPTPSSPLRTPMPGHRHADVVPVCYA
jgi:SAM-dependent methyltransferase